MTDENRDPHRHRQWVGLIVATVLGIVATLGVGWYQLAQAEKQAILAEQERARSVRQSLVAIVEEHVLNDKPIDLPRLARLTDQQRREERVATPITVSEILEQAEFNLVESRYLPFERKQVLKSIFDGLYAELSSRAFQPFPATTPNAELLNTLAGQVQEGKSKEALESLTRLSEAQAREVESARAGRAERSLSDVLRQVLENPYRLAFLLLLYVLLILLSTRRSHLLRRLLTSRPYSRDRDQDDV